MTSAQKKAQANFKKAIAYRKKTGCSLKQAFAHVKNSKVTGLEKVVKKGSKTTVLYSKKHKTKKAAPKKKTTQGKLFGIGNVMTAGKNLLLEKLGKLEAKKFVTPTKTAKRKIQKEITHTKTQLRKFLK